MTDVYDKEIRHRVIIIGFIYDSGDIYSDEVREFKSNKGAEKFAEQRIREGKHVVVQHGIVKWMADDEIEDDMKGFFVTRVKAF